MVQYVAIPRLPVQVQGGHPEARRPRPRCLDPEGPALAYAQAHLLEEGAPDEVLRIAWASRVQPQGCHHVPGRDLPAIVVAAEAPGAVAVLGGEDFPHARLRAQGFPGRLIQKGDVVAGLIAVPVVTPGLNATLTSSGF